MRCFGGGAVIDESMVVAVQARMALVTGALAPYDAGRYLNFVEEPTHAEVGFPAESYGGCRRRAGHVTRTSGSRRIIGSRS
jgi:hypothetical protein